MTLWERRIGLIATAAGLVMLCGFGADVSAQSAIANTAGAPAFKTGGDVLTMPSMWRIVGGFALTVGIAFAAVHALKRFLPRLTQRFSTVSAAALQVQTSTQNGVRYHIVKCEGQTILVAEGRSGLAMTVLPTPQNDNV